MLVRALDYNGSSKLKALGILGAFLTLTPSAAGVAQEEPAKTIAPHILEPGDILGVYVSGVLGDRAEGPPIHVDEVGTRIGFPIRVRADGTIRIPWIDPVPVKGSTVQTVETLVSTAFVELFKQRSDLPVETPEVVVTLIRERLPTEPAVYRARKGDILAVFIAGLIGELEGPPQTQIRDFPGVAPSLGLPIPIEGSGLMYLPYAPAIQVDSLTPTEIEAAIRKATIVDLKLLRADKLERIIVSPLWRAPEALKAEHQLDVGDTVALFVEGLYWDHLTDDLVHIPTDGKRTPFWGIPFPIRSDGTVSLPLIPPLKVAGASLTEARQSILAAYTVDQTIIKMPPPIFLSLIREFDHTRRGVSVEYTLGSNDVVCILGLDRVQHRQRFYFPEDPTLAPCFGELFPILPDGTLVLPSIGRINAKGRTVRELEYAIDSKRSDSGYVLVRVARRSHQ